VVITGRLHAAFPALALGTNIVFAPEDPTDPRFSGLADFLPTVVPMRELGRLPVSVFNAAPWPAVRDFTEQAQVIRTAVQGAIQPGPRRTASEVAGSDRLLIDLERAALNRERVDLADLTRFTASRTSRYGQRIRRLLHPR
jgi:hypothetical protein